MSNEKYDDWFDEAFDEAFDRAASRHSLPTSDESKRQSWQQVKLQVERLNKRKQRRRKYQYAGVIAASMAFGAFMFSQPAVTQAVSPIYQQIVDWGNGIAGQIFGKNTPVDDSKALTPPPPDVSSTPNTDQVPEAELVETEDIPFSDSDQSLIKSQQRVNFNIPKAGYIPDGFAFSEATGISDSENGPIYDLHVHYMNADGKVLTITYVEMLDNRSVGVGGEVKETIKLDSGATAYLSETTLRFLYDNDQILVMISGFFPKEELLKVANNLQ